MAKAKKVARKSVQEKDIAQIIKEMGRFIRKEKILLSFSLPIVTSR